MYVCMYIYVYIYIYTYIYIYIYTFKTVPKVQSLMDMRHEMRRNEWPNEKTGSESQTKKTINMQ